MATDHAVVVLAATNHPESLDTALTRAGRFDRKVELPVPDEQSRKDLFEYYMSKLTTAANFEEKSTALKMKLAEQKKAAEAKRNAPEAPQKRTELAKLQKQLTELEEAKEKKPNQDKLEGVLREQIAKLRTDLGDGEEVFEANLTPPTGEEVADAKALVPELAARTPGVTPASIATIANEAALVAADAGASFVTRRHVEDAIDNVLIGKKHRQRMSDHGLARTSYHEAGHCVAQWLLRSQTPVVKVSVIPRGRAGGFTQFRQQEALDPRTDQFLFDELVVLLGGRCAEKIFFGDLSTGASDDLTRAFEGAKSKVQYYGMSGEVGHIAVNPQNEQRGRAFSSVSEKLKGAIEDKGRAIVDRAYAECTELLEANRDKLEKVALALIEKKEITEKEIAEILGPKEEQPTPQAATAVFLASQAAAA